MLFRKVLSKIRPIAILTNLYHHWQQQDFSNHRQSNHPVQSNWDLKKERHGTKEVIHLGHRHTPIVVCAESCCSFRLSWSSLPILFMARCDSSCIECRLNHLCSCPAIEMIPWLPRPAAQSSLPTARITPNKANVANTIQALRINCNLVRGGGCTMIDHHPI